MDNVPQITRSGVRWISVMFLTFDACVAWKWWQVVSGGYLTGPGATLYWPENAVQIILTLSILSLSTFPVLPMMWWTIHRGKWRVRG